MALCKTLHFPAAVNPSARWRGQLQSLPPHTAGILGLLGATVWICLHQLGMDPSHLSPSLALTTALTHAHLNLSSGAAGIEPKFLHCPALISGRTEHEWEQIAFQ